MNQLLNAGGVQETAMVVQDHPIHFLVNVVTRISYQLEGLLECATIITTNMSVVVLLLLLIIILR